MSTFQRCPQEVVDLANAILTEFDSHKPLLDARVKIDFVFAYPRYDDHGNAVGDALRLHGTKAAGIARILPLKQRAMGRGDCEVSLDGEWWRTASEKEQRALLDHELHHFKVRQETNGRVIQDDLGRPRLQMRPHDYDFGWFAIVAERHGISAWNGNRPR